MANVALSAPTTYLGSASAGAAGVNPMTTPLVLPAAEGTSLSGFTGWSVPNNGSVLVRLVVGSSGAGTVTLTVQRLLEGQQAPGLTTAVSASTVYIWGPFSTVDFNDPNGLLQFAKSGTLTGDTVGVYYFAPNMFGR